MKKLVISLPIFLLFFIGFSNAQIYIPNETASFIVSVTDTWGNSLDANCSGYIFKNGSLIWQDQLQKVDNFYISSFTVPDEYGTYLQVAECNVSLYGIRKTIRASKTFFVSSAFDVIKHQLETVVNQTAVNVTLNITGNISEAVANATEDIIGLMLALHSTPETRTYCQDNQTLVHEKVANWTIRGKVYPIVKREVEICPYGCDPERNACNHPPYLYFSILLAAVVITYLAFKFIIIPLTVR